MAAAEKALALDPDLAEPHGVKAKIFTLQGRHDEASAEIAIAVELDPNSWDVNREAAMVMFRQDRIAEAAPSSPGQPNWLKPTAAASPC